MTNRIIHNAATAAAPASFTLANEAGDLVRTTAGSVYRARTLQHAEEAAGYLNSPRVNGVRIGSHRMQSMFGKF